MAVKIIIVALSAVAVIFLLVRYTNSWARALQASYVQQAIKLFGNVDGWDEKWRLNLFRVSIIFFGLMLILGVYVFTFTSGVTD